MGSGVGNMSTWVQVPLEARGTESCVAGLVGSCGCSLLMQGTSSVVSGKVGHLSRPEPLDFNHPVYMTCKNM